MKRSYDYHQINERAAVYALDCLSVLFSGGNKRIHINIDYQNTTYDLPAMTREQGRMLIDAIEAAIVKANQED